MCCRQARPKNKNLPHTCWIIFLVLASTECAADVRVVYCFLAQYCMGTLGDVANEIVSKPFLHNLALRDELDDAGSPSPM